MILAGLLSLVAASLVPPARRLVAPAVAAVAGIVGTVPIVLRSLVGGSSATAVRLQEADPRPEAAGRRVDESLPPIDLGASSPTLEATDEAPTAAVGHDGARDEPDSRPGAAESFDTALGAGDDLPLGDADEAESGPVAAAAGGDGNGTGSEGTGRTRRRKRSVEEIVGEADDRSASFGPLVRHLASLTDKLAESQKQVGLLTAERDALLRRLGAAPPRPSADTAPRRRASRPAAVGETATVAETALPAPEQAADGDIREAVPADASQPVGAVTDPAVAAPSESDPLQAKREALLQAKTARIEAKTAKKTERAAPTNGSSDVAEDGAEAEGDGEGRPKRLALEARTARIEAKTARRAERSGIVDGEQDVFDPQARAEDVGRKRRRIALGVLALVALGYVWYWATDQVFLQNFGRDDLAKIAFIGPVMQVFFVGFVLYRIARVGGKAGRWLFPEPEKQRKQNR